MVSSSRGEEAARLGREWGQSRSLTPALCGAGGGACSELPASEVAPWPSCHTLQQADSREGEGAPDARSGRETSQDRDRLVAGALESRLPSAWTRSGICPSVPSLCSPPQAHPPSRTLCPCNSPRLSHHVTQSWRLSGVEPVDPCPSLLSSCPPRDTLVSPRSGSRCKGPGLSSARHA